MKTIIEGFPLTKNGTKWKLFIPNRLRPPVPFEWVEMYVKRRLLDYGEIVVQVAERKDGIVISLGGSRYNERNLPKLLAWLKNPDAVPASGDPPR